jgi:putative ABC transport system ATP-binding protein
MELIRLSCDTYSQTTIVVTHDPRSSAYADRVVFLRDGKIEEELRFTTQEPLAAKMQQIIQVMEKLESE